jgi:hypothetical protein
LPARTTRIVSWFTAVAEGVEPGDDEAAEPHPVARAATKDAQPSVVQRILLVDVMHPFLSRFAGMRAGSLPL